MRILGEIYEKHGQMELAIECHNIAKEIDNYEINNSYIMDNGNTYAMQGDLDQAIFYYKMAITRARAFGDRFLERKALTRLVKILEIDELAIIDYKVAIRFAREFVEPYLKSDVLELNEFLKINIKPHNELTLDVIFCELSRASEAGRKQTTRAYLPHASSLIDKKRK